MGDKTKIDWCDASWNPVTGCLHGCKYCYARRIAERFSGFDFSNLTFIEQPSDKIKDIWNGMLYYKYPKKGGDPARAPYPYGFTPTFNRCKLDDPKRWTKPRTIFVCSMADLFGDWVPDEWIQAVFEACIAAPQHRYLFLTKNPSRYETLYANGILPIEGINGLKEVWFGTSVTTPEDPFFHNKGVRTFVSVEPIIAPFGEKSSELTFADWVIIGAETGNRKDKTIPEKSWIAQIEDKCRKWKTPLFMKESLRGIMGADFVQEYPWEAETK